MGIDARMFARIKGRENWKSPAEVRLLAYALGSTLGADHFFIVQTDDEDRPAIFGPPQHALSIVQPWAEDDYLPELKGRIVYTQDGDPIIADDDEQFIEVHLFTRYYGPGYERGNWPLIRTIAEFLEAHIPTCEVWYGGDSSGVEAIHLNAEARAEMHTHFLTNGHRPYVRAGGFSFPEHTAFPECPTCLVPMSSCGGGRGQVFIHCDGCGREEVFVNPRERYRVPHGKSLFEVIDDPSLGIRVPVRGKPVAALPAS